MGNVALFTVANFKQKCGIEKRIMCVYFGDIVKMTEVTTTELTPFGGI
jgi:hypothetical protein